MENQKINTDTTTPATRPDSRPEESFNQWIEKELARLEDEFADFVTSKSNRVFFQR